MAYIKYRVTGQPRPEDEALALEDVRAHLRLLPEENEDEDQRILLPLIRAARAYCENVTGRSFAAQGISAYPAAGVREVELPRGPVLAVERVGVTLADGTEVALGGGDWTFDPVDGVVRILDMPQGLRAYNPVEIAYRAGCLPGEVPDLVRQAMLLMIGHLYENREGVVVGAIAAIEVPVGVKNLLYQYKTFWF